MTDSTTRLREALSQIAADHTDDAPDPATLDAIWRAGRRRRWRARAGVVATLGVVALLVLGAFVPGAFRRWPCPRHHRECPWRATRNTWPCRGGRT
jgi:hypothetical protein